MDLTNKEKAEVLKHYHANDGVRLLIAVAGIKNEASKKAIIVDQRNKTIDRMAGLNLLENATHTIKVIGKTHDEIKGLNDHDYASGLATLFNELLNKYRSAIQYIEEVIK